MNYDQLSTFQIIVGWIVSVFAGLGATFVSATFLHLTDPLFRKLFRVE